MRTFNKMNTTDVKKARKQSKELRKLKMSKNTVMFIETDDKLKYLVDAINYVTSN